LSELAIHQEGTGKGKVAGVIALPDIDRAFDHENAFRSILTPCYIVKEEFPTTSGFAAESTVGTSGWRDA
jgi:hypothetical protein